MCSIGQKYRRLIKMQILPQVAPPKPSSTKRALVADLKLTALSVGHVGKPLERTIDDGSEPKMDSTPSEPSAADIAGIKALVAEIMKRQSR